MSLELEEEKISRNRSIVINFQNITNVDILTQNQNAINLVYKNCKSTYQITPLTK